ncbi:MAG: OmpL47-type beta-barrel domain-containing protein [Candidatus Coprovivens sp.]
MSGDNWTSGNVTVNLSSSDSSGIQKYQMSSNNSDWVDISGSQYTFSDKGAYTRYFRAVDKAGNTSSSSSKGFTIYSVGSSISLLNYTGKTIILSGSVSVPEYRNAVNLVPNNKYQVEFDYVCASETNKFVCDLYPDDLPQIILNATTTTKHVTWILTSSSSNMSSCYLRFFDDQQEENESDITITNITLKEISI